MPGSCAIPCSATRASCIFPPSSCAPSASKRCRGPTSSSRIASSSSGSSIGRCPTFPARSRRRLDLHAAGAREVVVKGLVLEHDGRPTQHVVGLDDDGAWVARAPHVAQFWSGSGDVFTALVTGLRLARARHSRDPVARATALMEELVARTDALPAHRSSRMVEIDWGLRAARGARRARGLTPAHPASRACGQLGRDVAASRARARCPAPARRARRARRRPGPRLRARPPAWLVRRGSGTPRRSAPRSRRRPRRARCAEHAQSGPAPDARRAERVRDPRRPPVAESGAPGGDRGGEVWRSPPVLDADHFAQCGARGLDRRRDTRDQPAAADRERRPG